IATETKPASSDTRVPQMTRDITSRPTLSVPSRWARSGRASALPRFWRSGSCGATRGAASAPTRATSSTAAPNGASRALAARRRTLQRRSAVADAGVDEPIEQVDHQVADDEADGDQQHDALNERIVAREHRVDHEATDAGQREDVLGDDGAADQRAELQAEHGD